MKKLIIAAFTAGIFLAACGNARDNAENNSDSITPTPGLNDPANSTYDPNTMDSANQMSTDSLRTDSLRSDTLR